MLLEKIYNANLERQVPEKEFTVCGNSDFNFANVATICQQRSQIGVIEYQYIRPDLIYLSKLTPGYPLLYTIILHHSL